MKIDYIAISGMHKVYGKKVYKLEDLTYLYGPNGSGKSTILQAIQLCLLGYIPNTNKTASAIFKHCNNDKLEVELNLVRVELQEPEQIKIIRTFTKVKSKIVEDLKVVPDIYNLQNIIGNLELPILNFNEFLNLTANKQKELMISILPSNINTLDTHEYLSNLDSYSVECDAIIDDISNTIPSLNSIIDVKALNSALKQVQSDLVAEDKRLTGTVQSLIFYDDYEGESDVTSLQNQINELLRKREASLKYEAIQSQYASTKQQLDNFSELGDCVENDIKYTELNSKRDQIYSDRQDYHNLIDVMKQQIVEYKSQHSQNQKIIDSKGICPYVEYNCTEIESKIPELSIRNSEIESAIAALNKTIELNKSKINQLSDDEYVVEDNIARLVNDYRTRDALLHLVESMETDKIDESTYTSSSQLSEQLKLLNDDLVKAAANQKYSELLSVLQKQRVCLDMQINFVKSAVKASGENGLQSELMIKPFNSIEKCMQNLLKILELEDLGLVKFNLESKANSFTFGLEREKFIPFDLLSSGEKCIFVLVFMCALVEISTSSLNFILIDDLFDHLDDGRFKTVIDNINKISQKLQIIVAGVKVPQNNLTMRTIEVGVKCD